MVAAIVKVPQELSRKRIYHGQPQPCQSNDDDEQNGDRCCKASHRTDLFLGNLCQRLAVTANRSKKNDEIVHSASEHHADHQPQKARQKAELGGQHGTNQGSGTGNGSEVMPEQDPLVGWKVVVSVIKPMRGSLAGVIQNQNLGGNESAVVAIANRNERTILLALRAMRSFRSPAGSMCDAPWSGAPGYLLQHSMSLSFTAAQGDTLGYIVIV